MRAKLGPINRAVAAILSLIWACAGMAGLAAAYTSGHWLCRSHPVMRSFQVFIALTTHS